MQTAMKPPAGADLRQARRKPVLAAGLIVIGASQQSLDCTIRDVSSGGARIALPRNIQLPAALFLIHVRDRTAHEALVVWRGEQETGLSFARSFALSDIADPKLGFLKRLWLTRATR